MSTRTAAFLLLVVIAVPAARAQVEPAPADAISGEGEQNIDSNESGADETLTTSTSTTSVTTISTSSAGGSDRDSEAPVPGWLHLVRFSAVAGPIGFLLIAWASGAVAHYRLVRREQELFPAVRGSRTPQTTPMFVSAALFFVPVLLFAYFEIRSRQEIRLGISGIVDEWRPVTAQAWTTLVICLALALVPWLFARRADTVS